MEMSSKENTMEENKENQAAVEGKLKNSTLPVRRSKSKEAESNPAELSQPLLPPIDDFKKCSGSRMEHNQLQKDSSPSSDAVATMGRLDGSMQPLQSRAPGESALSSSEDAARRAAMSEDHLTIEPKHQQKAEGVAFDHQNSSRKSPSEENMGATFTKEQQQPEVLISSARRIPPEKKSRNKENTSESNHPNQKTTPQSPPDEVHDPPKTEPLTAAEQIPRENRGVIQTSHISERGLDYRPGSKNQRSLTEGPTCEEDLLIAPCNPPDLCTPKAALAQGRQETNPRPGEMPGHGGFRPINGLKDQPGSTFARPPISSRKHLQTSASVGGEKPFDLQIPRSAKRRRLGSNAFSSAGSSVKFEDSDGRSNTAQSEAANTKKSFGSRVAQSPKKYNGVSQTTEFRQVEAIANSSSSRGKRKSTDPPHQAKKRCLDNGIATKVSGRLENKHDSNMGNSRSLEAEDDPIQYSPPSIWTGTGRPSGKRLQNGASVAKEKSTKSPYFPQESRSRRPPPPPSNTDGSKVSVLEVGDSEDELAGDNPRVPSKADKAFSRGAQILKNATGKKSLPSRGDIQKTNFEAPGNTGPSNLSFALSSIVAGELKLENGHNSGSWHLVLNAKSNIFEPYKDGVLMAQENLELVVDPRKIFRIVHGTENKKLFIYRHLGPQKTQLVSIELESGDPVYFVQVLLGISKGIDDVKTATSENLDKRFINAWNRPQPLSTRHSPPQAMISDEISFIEQRKHQRRLESQQNGNKIPAVNGPPMKTRSSGMFNKVGHSTTIDSDSNDQKDHGHSESRKVAAEPPRRSTRATAQDERASTDTKDTRAASPPRPLWTESHPNWRKAWGPPKSLSYPRDGKDKAVVDRQDIERLDEGEFLNDNLIFFYLRWLQENLQHKNPEVAKNIYFHNTFFYNSLTKDASTKASINYDAVKRWTSKVDLFSKEFIVVPINEDTHWYLAIIYNAPALKQSMPKLSSEVNHGSALIDGHKTTDTQDGKAKIMPSRPASEQNPVGALNESEADLPGLADMTIDDKKDLHGDQIRSGSREAVKSRPASKEPVVNELLELATPSPASIPDSQPNSPQKVSSRASSVLVRRQSPQATPQTKEQVTSMSTPSVKRSSSKKDKKGPRAPDIHKAHIIILDSLGFGHGRTSANLKSYLIAEADAKLGLSVDKTAFTGPKQLKAWIPQQTNFCDCGLFLLGYAEQFLKDPNKFVQNILTTEMRAQWDWGHMDASKMRNEIRELIFQYKADQDGTSRDSPKKTSQPLANGKSKGPENSSRETSVQSSRPRHTPDSPSQQLRNDRSRPSSSGSQRQKIQTSRETSQLPVTGQDIIAADKVSALEREKKSHSGNNGIGRAVLKMFGDPFGQNKDSPKKVPSSPTKKSSRRSSDAQDSPSRSRKSSSMPLESGLLVSLQEERSNPSSSRGSSRNPISVDVEDELAPSSPSTLVHPQNVDIDSNRFKRKEPSIRVEVLREAPRSPEIMLLDNDDDFLKHPVAATALPDDQPVPGAFPTAERTNCASTPVASPVRASAKSEATPASISQGPSRQHTATYSRKGKAGNGVRAEPEVVDLS